MIYRIVQEQLNNIIKYADAQNVTIRIEIDHPQVIVSIKDDGIGFETDKLESWHRFKKYQGKIKSI